MCVLIAASKLKTKCHGMHLMNYIQQFNLNVVVVRLLEHAGMLYLVCN